MKKKIYRNTKTDEFIYREDAEEYALDTLGITIIPKGQNGEMTQEQIESIQAITEWYYSGGEWYNDVIEEDEGNIFELINEECYYNDKWEEKNKGGI